MVVWGKYSNNHQAEGIAQLYALANHPYTRHRHNVIMDANLFLDLTGIPRHYTTACK